MAVLKDTKKHNSLPDPTIYDQRHGRLFIMRRRKVCSSGTESSERKIIETTGNESFINKHFRGSKPGSKS